MRLHEMVAEVRAAGGDEFEEMVAGALGALIAEDMEAFGEFCAAARAIAGWTFGGMLGRAHVPNLILTLTLTITLIIPLALTRPHLYH